MLLAFLGWIVVGVIVGWIGTMFVNLNGDTPMFAIGAGAAGAVVVGLLHASIFTEAGIAPWQMWNLLFAAVGAAIGTTIYHAIRSRSISHDRQTVRTSY